MNKILMSMLAIILAFDAHAETELQRLHKVEESVASLKMQHRFSPKLQEKAAGFQWVLVDGIFGDALSEGSSDFQNVLEKEVGASNIEVIRPSSLDSIQENAEFLDGYFSLLSRKGPPLMIVAHSRGALSTLLALAANPELVESGRIAGAVYIQGAFAGSPLAEYVDSKVHGLCNLFAIKSLNATCEVYEAFAPSIETLKPEIVRKELGLEFSKLSSQQLGNLSSKSFFVKSKVSPGHASTPLKAGAIYLKMFYGENDGIILTAAQQPENFGTSLGTFEGDHKSLLNFSKSDNDSYSTQKTFARALLRFLLK